MNKFVALIVGVMIITLAPLPSLGLRYSQVSLVLGVAALALAPVAIHKVPNKSISIGLLMALALYASFPIKKLFQLDGFFQEVPVTLIYCGALWIIGAGWKRSWK